ALNLGGATLDNAASGTFSNLVVSGGTILSGTILRDGGVLSLTSATFTAITCQGDLAIASGGSLAVASGLTVASGGVLNNGTVAVQSGGQLELDGAVSGTGVIGLRGNAVVALDAAVGSGQTIDFVEGVDSLAILRLADPNEFQGTVTGFGG